MCGRYGFVPGENFYNRFEIHNRLDNLEPHYNIAPGQLVPVITRSSPNQVILMKWGLIPHWAKDPRIGYKMINARAETLNEKPTFKYSLKNHRCLIPTSGFYEWKHIGEDKIPFYIRLKGKDMFAFAGLYDIWKDAEGYPLKTFTIITTSPNEFMSTIHHRMPVILTEEAEDIWLDQSLTDIDKLLALLTPTTAEMESIKVSKLVNNPNNDSPEIIKPVKD